MAGRVELLISRRVISKLCPKAHPDQRGWSPLVPNRSSSPLASSPVAPSSVARGSPRCRWSNTCDLKPNKTQRWINGHFRNLNWRYLPYIRPKFQGISPQFIWSKIWYVYVPPSIGSWRSRANPRHLVLSVLQEKGVAHRWPHLWGHKLGMHTATRTLPTSEKSLKSPEIHT